jgi:hypothetical protein
MLSKHTGVAQVGLVSRSLVADIFDAVVDVLVGFRETCGGDALVGYVVGGRHYCTVWVEMGYFGVGIDRC